MWSPTGCPPEDRCSTLVSGRSLCPSRARTYQNNQLNQTLAAHQATDGQAFSPEQLVGASSEGAACDLADESTGDDTDNICPGDAIVQETQVRVQTREGKIEGQEQDRDEIFNLLGKLDGETAVVRADQADQEGAEDGMNANNACAGQ
jgi:hypothetical protein